MTGADDSSSFAKDRSAAPHDASHARRPRLSRHTFAEFELLDEPVWTVLEEAPAPPPPHDPWQGLNRRPVAADHSAQVLNELPKAVALSVPRVTMSAYQLDMLTEALARVRCRPGEDGLPPAVLFFDLRSRSELLPPSCGDAAKRRIQTCVRDGDVAVKFDDHTVALLCGGLFFPGDVEVIGTRVRKLVLETRQVLFKVDDLDILVGGALATPGEDVGEFLARVSARAHVLEQGIDEVLVDYGSASGSGGFDY